MLEDLVFIAPINDGDNNVILDQWIGIHITHWHAQMLGLH